jgi:hypothetical protein
MFGSLTSEVIISAVNRLYCTKKGGCHDDTSFLEEGGCHDEQVYKKRKVVMKTPVY